MDHRVENYSLKRKEIKKAERINVVFKNVLVSCLSGRSMRLVHVDLTPLPLVCIQHCVPVCLYGGCKVINTQPRSHSVSHKQF